jgi:CubicO group peptidase (beta-lactamase class C family)
MILKKIFSLTIAIFIIHFAFSQNLYKRTKTEKSFIVLKNNQQIIPFIRLDTLRISFDSNSNKDKIFLKSISRYTNINKSKNKNLKIFCYYSDTSSIYKLACCNQKSIICLFGKAKNLLNKIENLKNIEAIIYSDFNDSLAIDYAGQLLFGAFGAKTIQDPNLSDKYKNCGIKTIGGIRFKYTIPAELGLDSEFIFHKIDSIANYAIKHKATPGCQIFAAINKKVFINKSYGFHTYDSIIPVRNNDLYDLASITKIAASAPCLMKLYQDKKIKLNARFSRYWHKFRFSNKRKIILIDALCHQARLEPWIPFWKYTLDKENHLSKKIYSTDSSKKFPTKVAKNLFIRKNYSKKIYRQIKKSKLLAQKKYKYSDLSFYIYPQIVEKITKESFEKCLNENFYKKLGANLCFNPLRFYSSKQIIPSEKDDYFRNQLLDGYVDDEGAAMLGGISGHAGLFGNANDLAKLMQMYLNYGKYGKIRYIDSTTIKQWTSYQFKNLGNRRGIVFDKPLLKYKQRGTPSPSASAQSFGHSGFTGTFAWDDPKNKLVFIFLSNRIYPSRKNKKLLKYNIRTNIHQVLYDAIKNSKNKLNKF